MNPYLETLKDELREECGTSICQADWDCFWRGISKVDDQVRLWVFAGCIYDNDESSIDSASYAKGTRADLPSIIKYAYAAIEENLK